MLLEIHVLQNHAPSNLNRDDTGSPKECVFGGVRRARISSQCLKRTIRRSDIFQTALAGHLGTRTRRLPTVVRDRLIASGIAKDLADIAAKKASGFGTKEGKERPESLDTAQTMFLTEYDIAAVTETLKAAAEKTKTVKAFDALKAADLQKEAQGAGFRPISVDVALFGRMTTSEALRDVEAATQVAHALSTHKVDHEYDYFTAVDDLQGLSEVEEDAGADMIGDVEFNSACYYKYLSIDVDGLVKNLTGEAAFRPNVSDDDKAAARTLAADAIDALIRALIMVTPTGKQNSFAAHQLPALIVIEARPTRTPVSYANAFVEPARTNSKIDFGNDLVTSSLVKFKRHVEALTKGFNLKSNARLSLSPEYQVEIDGITSVADLDTLCTQVRVLMGGTAVGNG